MGQRLDQITQQFLENPLPLLLQGNWSAQEVLWEALDGLPDILPVHPKHSQEKYGP